MDKDERPKVGRPASYTSEQLLNRLVEAAIAILDEQAANADFSVAQVAQRAKVSKRSVYTVISSKEELIGHIIERGAKVADGVGARRKNPAALAYTQRQAAAVAQRLRARRRQRG